jgi:hypothetical protein
MRSYRLDKSTGGVCYGQQTASFVVDNGDGGWRPQIIKLRRLRPAAALLRHDRVARIKNRSIYTAPAPFVELKQISVAKDVRILHFEFILKIGPHVA